MELKIISTEIIKPSSPTPKHLKIFKLSRFDQLAPSNYSRIIYFYDAKGEYLYQQTKRVDILKASLPTVLTLFYPFAGRFRDHVSIECNDQGVEFIDARIDCVLFTLLKKHDCQQLPEELFPVKAECDYNSMINNMGRLLRIQANTFQCGSISIVVCISHKLADAASIFTFVNTWSSITRNSKIIPRRLFTESVLLDPFTNIQPNSMPSPFSSLQPLNLNDRGKCIRKRFVFSAKNITALKAKMVDSSSAKQSTRVEAVTTLLWKCILTTSRSATTSICCCRRINLRKGFSPPIPSSTVGNFVGLLGTPKKVDKKEDIDLNSLFSHLRRDAENFKILESTRAMVQLDMDDDDKNLHLFHCSSICGMPVYEADFGWENPFWVCVSNVKVANVAYLLDTRDLRGIEALVCLSEEDMHVFECNEELLEFSTPSPQILQPNCSDPRISRL